MITLTKDDVNKVELYVKKASGFLKRPDLLSVKTARAYLEKAVNLLKIQGFDVERQNTIPTYKKGQRSEGKQYFCQNANCPNGKVLLDYKNMYIRNGMVFCACSCADIISPLQS